MAEEAVVRIKIEGEEAGTTSPATSPAPGSPIGPGAPPSVPPETPPFTPPNFSRLTGTPGRPATPTIPTPVQPAPLPKPTIPAVIPINDWLERLESSPALRAPTQLNLPRRTQIGPQPGRARKTQLSPDTQRQQNQAARLAEQQQRQAAKQQEREAKQQQRLAEQQQKRDARQQQRDAKQNERLAQQEARRQAQDERRAQGLAQIARANKQQEVSGLASLAGGQGGRATADLLTGAAPTPLGVAVASAALVAAFHGAVVAAGRFTRDMISADDNTARFVGSLGSSIPVIGAFTGALSGLMHELDGWVARLGDYSPRIAQADAMSEVVHTLNEIRRAQEASAGLSAYIRARTDLQQTVEDAKTRMMESVIPTVISGMKIIEKLMPGIELSFYWFQAMFEQLTTIGQILNIMNSRAADDARDDADFLSATEILRAGIRPPGDDPVTGPPRPGIRSPRV